MLNGPDRSSKVVKGTESLVEVLKGLKKTWNHSWGSERFLMVLNGFESTGKSQIVGKGLERSWTVLQSPEGYIKVVSVLERS